MAKKLKTLQDFKNLEREVYERLGLSHLLEKYEKSSKPSQVKLTTLQDLLDVQDEVYKKAGHGNKLKRYGEPKPSKVKPGEGRTRVTIVMPAISAAKYATRKRYELANEVQESIKERQQLEEKQKREESRQEFYRLMNNRNK